MRLSPDDLPPAARRSLVMDRLRQLSLDDTCKYAIIVLVLEETLRTAKELWNVLTGIVSLPLQFLHQILSFFQ